MYKTVIWATDGSDGAEVALAEAVRLAALSGGRVYAVHCDQRLDGRPGGWLAVPERQDRRAAIRRRVADLRREGVDIEVIVRRSHGEAADAVAAVAAELGGDVIVCGTRGLGAVPRDLAGSFPQRLLQVAQCPVLAVRERDDLEPAPARKPETAAIRG